MRKTKDSISKKRQQLSLKLQILKERLLSPGLTSQQTDFLREEIKKLKTEINQLVVGTRAQKKSGWARGVDAPEFKK